MTLFEGGNIMNLKGADDAIYISVTFMTRKQSCINYCAVKTMVILEKTLGTTENQQRMIEDQEEKIRDNKGLFYYTTGCYYRKSRENNSHIIWALYII